jgi:hypothetical protein
MSKIHSRDKKLYYQAGLIIIVLASLACIIGATVTVLGTQNSPPPVDNFSAREQQLQNAINLLGSTSSEE